MMLPLGRRWTGDPPPAEQVHVLGKAAFQRQQCMKPESGFKGTRMLVLEMWQKCSIPAFRCAADVACCSCVLDAWLMDHLQKVTAGGEEGLVAGQRKAVGNLQGSR